MRKRFLIFLAGILLTVIISATAEYKNYQITEGNWWDCFPLDAHNTVVAARLWTEDSEPDLWYVCWYRDGKLYRKLTGTIPDPEQNQTGRLLIPYPATWDGEHLSMYYCVQKEKLKTYIQGTWIPTPDPGSFDTYMADWTENGLENERILPEAWFDVYDHVFRRIVVYTEEKSRTALYNGRETVLPDSIPATLKENVLRILPVNNDSYLVKVMDNGHFCSQVVCVDQGKERYRVTLPQDEINPGRILLPEKNGGFFCMDGFRGGGYEPEHLMHYTGDGQYDRTLVLAGNNVVVHACESTTDPESGLCTLYGIAVANSRSIYTAFAMTIDENLNVSQLDVRKIDPDYRNYNPEILIASDGTPYVFVENMSETPRWPVLIPFSELKKSNKTYGLRLLQ